MTTTTTTAGTTVIWQRIFHATLYKFSQKGREEILNRFRSLADFGSASCVYNSEEHHFEISCLIQEGQRAEDLLTQIIAAYLEEDANHATDSANYSRQASKFPQAIVGNDSSWEDDASDGGHRLGSDQLIDFEYVAVKDFWVPANPAVVIENFCTLALLEEIGNLTGCNLSLDEQNRQVAIQPGPAPDVAAAKTKLTNLEAVNANDPAIVHLLKTQKQQIFKVQFCRLFEKKDPHPFNEDGTLTRLLLSKDSLLVSSLANDKLLSEDWTKRLDRLFVLRYWKQTGDKTTYEPQKRNVTPIRTSSVPTASRHFANMRVRSLGDKPPSDKSPPEPPRGQNNNDIEQWQDGIEKAKIAALGSQQSHIDVMAISSVSQQDRTSPVDCLTQRAPSNQHFPSQATARTAAFSSDSMLPSATFTYVHSKSRLSVQQSSASETPYISNSNHNDNKSKSSNTSTWGTASKSTRKVAGPSPSHRINRQGMAKPESSASDKSRKAPQSSSKRPTPRPVASENPFGSLGDLGDDETQDDDDVESPTDAFATNIPTQSHTSTKQAPSPPPIIESSSKTLESSGPARSSSQVCDTYLRGFCGKGQQCSYKHESGTLHTESRGALNETPNGTNTSNFTDAKSVSTLPPGNLSTMQKSPEQNSETNVIRPGLDPVSFGHHSSTVCSALEKARAVQGTISAEVQIGQVIVKDVPRECRKEFTSKNFDAVLQQIPRFDTPDKTFTNHLTTSVSDMDSLLEVLGASGQDPFHECTFFEFTCRRSDASFVKLIVDALDSDSGNVEAFAKSPESLHCIVYAHHPQRVWDSRLVISSCLKHPLHGCGGASGFVEKLYVRQDDEKHAGPSVQGDDDDGLEIVQCRLYTMARWRVTQNFSPHEPIYVQIAKVLDLPIYRKNTLSRHIGETPVLKGPYKAKCETKKEMIDSQQLWLEVSLGLMKSTPLCRENEPHANIVDPALPWDDHAEVDRLEVRSGKLQLGEKASWKPEDVLSENELLALHDVATRVVEKIDGIGAKNRGLGADREETLIKKRKTMENEQDTFW